MQTKVQVGGLAGALTVLIVWILNSLAHVDVPPEVASAFTVIIGTLTAWLVPQT